MFEDLIIKKPKASDKWIFVNRDCWMYDNGESDRKKPRLYRNPIIGYEIFYGGEIGRRKADVIITDDLENAKVVAEQLMKDKGLIK